MMRKTAMPHLVRTPVTHHAGRWARLTAFVLAILILLATACVALVGLRDLWVFLNLYAQMRAGGH